MKIYEFVNYDFKKNDELANEVMTAWVEEIEKFDSGYLNIRAELAAVESAIGGSTVLNKASGMVAKLGNIFTARQSGFKSNIDKMLKIDPVGIKREPTILGLNPEIAQEYLRISQAFNLNVSEHSKSKWIELARDLEAEIDAQNDVALNALKTAVKLCVAKYIAAATIIFIPFAIFMHIMQYYYIGYALGTKLVAKQQAGVEIVLRKGQEMLMQIMSSFVYETYLAIDPKNTAHIKMQDGKLSPRDTDIAINHILSVLQNLKRDMTSKAAVEYDDKIKAAETIKNSAKLVYPTAVHTLTPSNMDFMRVMTTKLSTRGNLTPEMQEAGKIYMKLGAAADLYFDITNMIVANLYNM